MPVFTARKLTAPFAALTMAALLFIYSRTSIRAAKRNAQRHREADGGQISWYNESQRRHGALERPGAGETETVGQVREMVGELREQGRSESERRVAGERKTLEEEKGMSDRIGRGENVHGNGMQEEEMEMVGRVSGLKQAGGRNR